MKELKFNLTIAETNLILKALGNLPYNQVFELMQKIHGQSQQQFSAAEEPVTLAAKNGSH